MIRKQIEFKLEVEEMKSNFFLAFLLRYDPFSRLKIEGEVVVKLSDLNLELLKSGLHVEANEEIKKSKQQFTAFVFRPS